MTIIEIRPFKNAWQVYEALGVQPVFLSQQQAIDDAKCRACFLHAAFARVEIIAKFIDTFAPRAYA
jgi:hypothetical protein